MSSVTSFSAPSQVDYGYRVSARRSWRGKQFCWNVRVNDDQADAFGVLASGEAASIDQALRDAEFAARGLPDTGRRWPDGYEPTHRKFPQRSASVSA